MYIYIYSLILKHLVSSFIYAVFAGISSPLSSFSVKIFLFFDAFCCFLLCSFWIFCRFFLYLVKKKVKKFFVIIQSITEQPK